MRPIALLAILALLTFFSDPGFADEILLKSGARFKGTIEEESDTEIVIRTDLGRMRFGRADVAEIKRASGGPPAAKGVPLTAKVAWTVKAVIPEVSPAISGSVVVLPLRGGELAALRVTDGRPVWRSKAGGRLTTGLAANSGGVYLGTINGKVIRLDIRNGAMMWKANAGAAIVGPPLLHRRGVFVLGAGAGLVGIESATGDIRGVLSLDVTADTPLAAVGARILVGDQEGALLNIANAGQEIAEVLHTPGHWDREALAVSLRAVVLGGDGELVLYDPEKGQVTRRSPVPGLESQPFAADPSRAYAMVKGALTALDLLSGRTAWRSEVAGSVSHVTIAGATLLITTTDGTLCSLSRADGSLRWSVALSAPAASPPIAREGLVVVITKDGDCVAYREAEGEAQKPPRKTEKPKPESRRRSPHILHSPHGFRMAVPDGWAVSEEATKGAVLAGLRPLPENPRFVLGDAPEVEKRMLALTCYIAVLTTPAGQGSSKELASRYLAEEGMAARQAGYANENSAVSPVKLGGRDWTEIRLDQVLEGENETSRFNKRVLFGPLGKDRIVWFELKTPEMFHSPTSEDYERVVVSFAEEDPAEHEVADEVRVVEEILAALAGGDVKSVLRHFSEPVGKLLTEKAPGSFAGRLGLIDRISLPAGSLREVRVRVDAMAGTRYAGVLLDREEGRWVVVDATGLAE